MTPYPDSFPLDEIKLAAVIVQSNAIMTRMPEFSHAAWVIIGYGLSKSIGAGPLIAGSMPPSLERQNGLEALNSMIVDNPDVVQAIPPIVWKTAIQFLLEVLLKAL